MNIKDLAKKHVLEVAVPGKPDTKKRPRAVINPKTGKPIVYGIDGFAENRVVSYMKSHFPAELVQGPVHLFLTFVYPYPGWLRKDIKIYEEIFGSPYIPKTSTPDGDNLMKFTKDSMNKFFWKDDSQVYREVIEKYYGPDPDPYTIIKIEYLLEPIKDIGAKAKKLINKK